VRRFFIRQIARYVAEVGRTYVSGVKPMHGVRLDRYLRGGDHNLNLISKDSPRCASQNIARTTPQHQNVRTENGIEYGDLPKS